MDEELPDIADLKIIRDKSYLGEIVDLHHLVRENLPANEKNYLLPKAAGYFFAAMNDQDRFIIAVMQEKKILGFAVLIISESLRDSKTKGYITAPIDPQSVVGKVAVIQSLCVDPNNKSRGVSKGIIQKAIDIVTERGIGNLYAQVAVDNEACWRIFQNKGFGIHSEWTVEHRRYLLNYFS